MYIVDTGLAAFAFFFLIYEMSCNAEKGQKGRINLENWGLNNQKIHVETKYW